MCVFFFWQNMDEYKNVTNLSTDEINSLIIDLYLSKRKYSKIWINIFFSLLINGFLILFLRTLKQKKTRQLIILYADRINNPVNLLKAFCFKDFLFCKPFKSSETCAHFKKNLNSLEIFSLWTLGHFLRYQMSFLCHPNLNLCFL